MIFRKLWRWVMAKINTFANRLRGRDPIAEMQYECDLATEQVKDGRLGLALHWGLVERVVRQVEGGKRHAAELAAKVKSYLASGDRETAAKFALELQKAETQNVENESQLALHRQTYESNLIKVKHAGHKINEVRERIVKYDADLKMSKAEAEIAKLSSSLNFDVTTDFGQVERAIQEKIDSNRAAVRVAADLSGQGLEEVRRDQDVERHVAEEALLRFEHHHQSTAVVPVS